MRRNQPIYVGDPKINKIMETFTAREITQPERYLINRHANYIREYCNKTCQGFWGKCVTRADAIRMLKHIQIERDRGGEDDALDYYTIILNVILENYEVLEDCELLNP